MTTIFHRRGSHGLALTMFIDKIVTVNHGCHQVARDRGKTVQSWALGTICYAVCHVCRCCSWARYVRQSATYVTAVFQWLYKLNEFLSVPIFVPTKHHKFSQKWNNCPYKQWYVCRRCSSMPIPVKSTYNRYEILHNLKAWCRPTKHHKFSQRWNNCPYKHLYGYSMWRF